MEYKSNIDGLRGLSVLFVILFHAQFKNFSGGFLGVDIFFVISGFLITGIILNELNNNTFKLTKFYNRRIRRIVPMLLFTIFICIPFSIFTLIPYKLFDFSQSIFFSILFISNFFFWWESGYFAENSFLKPLLHTWSLGVEGQFYLFFPLIFLLFKKKNNQLFIILLLFSLSFVSALYFSNNNISFNFYSTFSRIWELLLGSIIFFLPKYKDLNKNLTNIISFLCIFLILFSIIYFDETFSLPNQFSLIPCISTAVLLYLSDCDNLVNKFLSQKILVKIGLISYSIYLLHQPIFSFYRNVFEIETSLIKILLIIFVILISFLTYAIIEQPFRNKKYNLFKYFVPFSTSIIFISLLFSFIVWNKNGLIYDYGNIKNNLLSFNPDEQGRYVRKNFQIYENEKFSQDQTSKKILIIGDSYAQDFINIILENKFINKFEFSTFSTIPQCGIYFGNKNIDAHIDYKYRNQCRSVRIITNENILYNLKYADYIFFAANWRLWDAKLIYESIKFIKLNQKQKYYVIGKKDFGKTDFKKLINKSEKEIQKHTNIISDDFIYINNYMKNLIPSQNFINLHETICPKINECNIIVNDYDLISHDGSHLTEKGAQYVGEIIFKKTILSEVFY